MDRPVIAIHGAPRSGTSWLGEIFKSSPQVAYRYQPLFSYAFKDRIGPGSTALEIENFFSELWATDDDFVMQRDPAIHPDQRTAGPMDSASHLVYKEVRYHHVLENLLARSPQVSVVGVIRHPCAVIDSWWHASKEFDPTWAIASEWRHAQAKNQGRPEEFYGYERWKEAARILHRVHRSFPGRAMIVRYAELNARPQEITRMLFGSLGIDPCEATDRFIAESRARDGGSAYSVFRKARPDDVWKRRLPRDIVEAIAVDLEGDELQYLLQDGD